ncbi:hypothetical protein A1Q1_06809 [Trichosporon asahii var. asahii CBS 2479]|uniref:PITH domain-containing protein n=1 Tax=Trichosporon asahii var. asahii (strain ATCC 90039 / CBS 2479 / JCM 2466 / KCTC 7840 / NBRC 103889/ NCYC 2677 / UAMH 7654) TaxID=1186058 RepID=J4UJH7_TRIAS|nr:hypothetical protein A1Q1_06809 [Trichosporon asahii var. asahii CBS 2479]EJT51940.1 hypothetical protein A1Q1_06809 [Trichosporon asahii var. asahii CBS 2479]
MPCHDECHEDHDHDIPLESGPQDSLYKVVDTEHVRALNADGGPEKGKVVIKDWANRDDETIFANGAGLDFSDAEDREPTQTFEVVDTREPAEYQVKAAKFASVTSLALFFPHNISEGDDDETTRVYYVGLRGSWRPLPNALGQIVYEAAPRPTDHKVKGDAMAAAPRQGF